MLGLEEKTKEFYRFEGLDGNIIEDQRIVDFGFSLFEDDKIGFRGRRERCESHNEMSKRGSS